MSRLPAFLVTLEAVRQDATLQPGARGARKLLVTELYPEKEEEATRIVWRPPSGSEKCQVQTMEGTEVAVFTEVASQDCHFHKKGTEIYMVLEGRMVIEVEGQPYDLDAGDMIVVNLGTVHQVKQGSTNFICRVVTIHCGGTSDRCPA